MCTIEIDMDMTLFFVISENLMAKKKKGDTKSSMGKIQNDLLHDTALIMALLIIRNTKIEVKS